MTSASTLNLANGVPPEHYRFEALTVLASVSGAEYFAKRGLRAPGRRERRWLAGKTRCGPTVPQWPDADGLARAYADAGQQLLPARHSYAALGI